MNIYIYIYKYINICRDELMRILQQSEKFISTKFLVCYSVPDNVVFQNTYLQEDFLELELKKL